jgi:hypothetical protein
MGSCPGSRPLQGFGIAPYGQSPYGTGQAPLNPGEFNPGPGYVAPTFKGLEVNDRILHRLLQQIVSGITGITGKLVYPRWQPEPPNQPDFDVDWAAVGIVGKTREVFPAVLHCTDASDPEDVKIVDTVYRNEILNLLCSFYGPNSEANGEILAMGLMLEQNRYVMFLNGIALVEVGDTTTIPALKKDRWLMGQDVPFRIRRQQSYTYPSANIEKFQGSVITDALTMPVPVSK